MLIPEALIIDRVQGRKIRHLKQLIRIVESATEEMGHNRLDDLAIDRG